MNRQEKDYLVQKLRTLSREKMEAFALAHPIGFSSFEILTRLRELGFQTPDPAAKNYYAPNRGYADITWPPTEEMKANVGKIAAYNEAVNKATGEAVDAVYLGSADAQTALASFREALDGLVA